MKSLRVLLVDDHDVVREGLRRLLASTGCVICGEAANGRSAVEQAIQQRPHVVVMDFSMPELNGLEAARQIRAKLPQTEILLLTMHDAEQLAREALAAGAQGLLSKTDVTKHLVAAVQSLAEHKPYVTPPISAALMNAFLHPERSAPMPRTTIHRLTSREREILQLVAEGRTSKEIAAKLAISSKTVEAHRANLMNKLDLHSISALVLYAVRNQIVQV